MATAKLTWEPPKLAAGNDIISVYGGYARATTKDIGVVTDSAKYPAAPFLFFALCKTEIADYWTELLYPAKEPAYLPIPTGDWAEKMILESSLASMQVSAAPQGGLFFAEWERLNLELMRLGSLRSDWDREGAEAVSPASVRTAQTLLRLAREACARYSPPQYSIPFLFASTDGGIAIKWHVGLRELKCVAVDDSVEVVRWSSTDKFESDGYWEIPANKVAEHFEWLLR
jgi:hypothetical protein